MRLIDADNIKEKILAYWGCDPSYYEGAVADRDTYLLSMLEITPTVDAIPVEWMEKWFENALRSANDGDDVTVDVMLDAWRMGK